MQIDAVQNYTTLFNIDNQLDKLVRDVELLYYLNPLNIEQEKRKFFASKYAENPQFNYRKLKFEPFQMQRLFFNLPLEQIKDPVIHKLYEDIIYEYSGLVECLASIGEGKRFYYNSLKVFGTPKERDVENAKFILHFEDDLTIDEMLPRYTANEAEAYFKVFGERYDFKFKIQQSTHISAEAMVLNATETLLLKKNHVFSENQLQVLANHEIGVHLVTTFNGKKQPLKIFSNGFVNNTETQEGLAVFSEYMSGCLTMRRLKVLAYRVLAADSLRKGYDFKDTFDLLHNQYKLDRSMSWQVTLRAHRGGGFTKDALYLTGLKKIYDASQNGVNYMNLLTGKVTLEYLETINKLQEIGLAEPAQYLSTSFVANNNKNKKLDFILKNLK